MTRLELATAALEAATEARRTAQEVYQAAQTELAAAKLEAAQFAPHPLAGQTVTRQEVQRGGMVGWRDRRPDRTVTQRGVVTLCGINGGTRYRNHCPAAGEWFVASISGGTAYRLTDDWKAV